MHEFETLDLSSNKISGTLLDSFQPSSLSLNLGVNRLSGDVPSALRTSNASINIIEGNLFGCPSLVNDETSNETECGSSNLAYPLISWLLLSVSIMFLAICIFYSKIGSIVRIGRYIMEWWSATYQYSQMIPSTMNAIRFLECASSMAVILAASFVLLVMMSILAIKLQGSSINTLYQVQYLYSTTSAFLVGKSPTVMIWIYVTVSGLVTVTLCVAVRPFGSTKARSSVKRITDNDSHYQYFNHSIIIQLVVGVVVSVIAIGVNIAFVYIVYYIKPPNLFAVNLAFAVIKSLVSITVIPYSNKLVPKASRQSYTIFMTAMVNVIGPGLAVMISSPLCFYNYFQKKSISASYVYPTYLCPAIWGTCPLTFLLASSSITPKWFYSYQCSSSFLTVYLPNFV